jgi:hypothetical protein
MKIRYRFRSDTTPDNTHLSEKNEHEVSKNPLILPELFPKKFKVFFAYAGKHCTYVAGFFNSEILVAYFFVLFLNQKYFSSILSHVIKPSNFKFLLGKNVLFGRFIAWGRFLVFKKIPDPPPL